MGSPEKKRKAGGVMSALFVLLILFYTTYHFVNYFSKPVETERVTSSYEEEIIRSEGLFFKTAVKVQGGAAGFDLLVKNGEKVRKDQTIAVSYSGEHISAGQSLLVELDDKISRLKDSIEDAKMIETDTGRLDTMLLEQLEKVSGSMDTDGTFAYTELGELRQLFCRRAVMYADTQEVLKVLASLEKEKAEAQKKTSGSVHSVLSQTPGYYTSAYDGLESALTAAAAQGLTIPLFEEYLNRRTTQNAPDGYIGSIVTDFTWKFAFLTDSKWGYSEGDLVRIRFPKVSGDALPAKVVRTVKDGTGRMLLVVEGDTLVGSLAALRKEPVELVRKGYSGFKISKSALHYVDGKAGVYVQNGAVVNFKTINILYSSEDHVIASAGSGKNPLSATDDVVVSGLDLYDGKIIK